MMLSNKTVKLEIFISMKSASQQILMQVRNSKPGLINALNFVI